MSTVSDYHTFFTESVVHLIVYWRKVIRLISCKIIHFFRVI